MVSNSQHLTLPKAIIFDVDGTLVDSIPLLLALPDYFAQLFNIKITEAQKQQTQQYFDDAMSGKTHAQISFSTKLLCKLIHQEDNAIIISILLENMKTIGVPPLKRIKGLKAAKIYFKEKYFASPFFPDVMNTLKILKNEMHIQLGILTMGTVEEFLSRFNGSTEILEIFPKDAILGRLNVPKVKPAPDGVFLLSKHWGIPCEEIWMVGDMETDILAGKAANAKTVGVLSGFLKREEMEKIHPDVILNNVRDILAYIDNRK
jgi:phosphoglycolate phosphatase-like HAD superfamily hydrolase